MFRALVAALALCSASLAGATRPQLPRPRIIGGEDSPDVPFFVTVYAEMPDDYGTNFCGGSLTEHGLVVTAAHCLIAPTGFAARVTLETVAGRMLAKAWEIHPEYASGPGTKDVAKIYSNAPRYVPEKLFLSAVDASPNETLVALGRGLTENGRMSETLKVVELREKSCDAWSFAHVGEDICASGACSDGVCRDTCVGDSGGPLYYSYDNKNYLYGVTSRGPYPCGDPAYPGIYASVKDSRAFLSTPRLEDESGAQLFALSWSLCLACVLFS